MATRKQAMAVIGPAVDVPLSTADYVTRYLRDDGLGPKGGPGGGKSSAHLERADLANILTALLSTTVLTEAPKQVRIYRALMPARENVTATEWSVSKLLRHPLSQVTESRWLRPNALPGALSPQEPFVYPDEANTKD